MKSLTIAATTARHEPYLDWLIDSLLLQVSADENVEIIQVKHGAEPAVSQYTAPSGAIVHVRIVPQKPNVWSGPQRLTKDEWWSKSNDLNTAICLATGEWLACVDDRSVLLPTWLDAVRRAMEGDYAVAGSYCKRHNMAVESGIIKDWGIHDGKDPRSISGDDHRKAGITGIVNAPGAWWFGCTNALPLEWALQVNGYNELRDSLRGEDCDFGNMLKNNNYPIRYDVSMEVAQDRTPGQCGPDLRSDCKETKPCDPRDKGHAALKRFAKAKFSEHDFNIRAVRESVQRGEPFPNIDPNKKVFDWFDGQDISTM